MDTLSRKCGMWEKIYYIKNFYFSSFLGENSQRRINWLAVSLSLSDSRPDHKKGQAVPNQSVLCARQEHMLSTDCAVGPVR